MIGKKGNTIQGIMEKSRVLNVKIMGDDEARKKNIDTKDKVSYKYDFSFPVYNVIANTFCCIMYKGAPIPVMVYLITWYLVGI